MKRILFTLGTFALLTGCSLSVEPKLSSIQPASTKQITINTTSTLPTEAQEIKLYQDSKPKEWGEKVTGVIQKLPTEEKVIALTFDACGGEHGSGYDEAIIQYLTKQQIPATLFINSRWIDANPTIFQKLANNPLFEIENHGTEHRPLSVNGRSIYGISGTKNIADAYAEVYGNHQKIKQLTGKAPKFFRSGTAYYDDVAVKIAEDLGEIPVNFDIIGDAGATYNAFQVDQSMQKAKAGSIIILHMNQPNSGTAEGIQKAIPRLIEKGYRFVKLETYLDNP
ncbi:polysaccharide deacetylase family protein [Shimazuella alba]|uniref:Polysaccharide deacetylase family protein n=1 Tax=Shimazuella alba TaxID=2690964 RepID=A0A6I4VSN1_9BACL|nr:polysaccharide deacetylase family protein [Shimazuella alba]MXQ52820.1 polysaccharide deacetylase family protein [Shimazuella alba]